MVNQSIFTSFMRALHRHTHTHYQPRARPNHCSAFATAFCSLEPQSAQLSPLAGCFAPRHHHFVALTFAIPYVVIYLLQPHCLPTALYISAAPSTLPCKICIGVSKSSRRSLVSLWCLNIICTTSSISTYNSQPFVIHQGV